MSGTLFLLPVQLGEAPWQAVLPAETREKTCQLQDFIVENAKSARASLKWLEHPTPLREITINALPEPLTATEIDRLISPLLAGRNVGLISEAGCPAVADPGALIVRRAHEKGIPVKPLVGPSSLLLALMASGLEGQRFAFHGYLPARDPERSRSIVQLEKESQAKLQTQLFIETPYRNLALLEAILASCRAETRLCVASGLTTATESIITRSIANWRRGELPQIDRCPTVFLLLA